MTRETPCAGSNLPDAFDERVDASGRGDQIGGGALQHGDLAGVLRQRGHQRDRGGAAADHDHLLAGVVQVLGPVLRMHHGAVEVLDAREVRGVALVVVVVAVTRRTRTGRGRSLVSRPCSTGHRPGVGGRIPVGGAHVAVEPDVAVDAVLARGVGQVLADMSPSATPSRPGPRLAREAQREDAAVRAHAGVAEQVPGAADALAAFQDDVADAGVAFGDAVGRAETGDTRADDHDVDSTRRRIGGRWRSDWRSSRTSLSRVWCSSLPTIGIDGWRGRWRYR